MTWTNRKPVNEGWHLYVDKECTNGSPIVVRVYDVTDYELDSYSAEEAEKIRSARQNFKKDHGLDFKELHLDYCEGDVRFELSWDNDDATEDPTAFWSESPIELPSPING